MKALRFSSSLPQYALLKALGSRSKRLFYKGPLATVRLADVTEPELPAPDWVKIKTSVCGFCGSDFNLVFLRESLTASPFISYPCTLGHELSGEVVEVGSGVR
ncbi:MAG: alcohol dehydrogenase, partial [Chloroflexi bacterium]